MNPKLHSLVLAAVILTAGAVKLHADPALLGNKELAGQTLGADAAKAILLGKRATIGNTRVVIILAKSSGDQDSFLKKVVGMTTDQFQTYWRRLYMTGGGSAPKVVNTEADASKLAAQTPGAVMVGDSANANGLAVLIKE